MNRANLLFSIVDLRTQAVCRLSQTLTWLVLACVLGGCRSTPPPPPQPALVAEADEVAEAATRLGQQGRWNAAVERWQQATDLYTLLNRGDKEAIARHNFAQALRQLGQVEAARRQLEQAVSINEAIGCQTEWWRNWIALIQLAAEQGDTNSVAAWFGELLGQAPQIEDPETRALFWNEAGVWHLQTGDVPRANAALAEARKAFVQAGDTAGLATALANQALVFETQEQFQAARAQWETAQAKFEEVGDPMGIATTLAGQGRVLLREKADLAAAESLLRRAAHSFEHLHADAALARTQALLEEAVRLRGGEEETRRHGDTETRR
jgi:tetratricopeptide (TPR) repeat protein